MKEAVQGCADLSILDLSGYWKMGANTLSEVLRSCTQLKVLNLSGCTQVNQDVRVFVEFSDAVVGSSVTGGKFREKSEKTSFGKMQKID